MGIIFLEKFYLGSLCRRNHDYEGTGKSLRYKDGNCFECTRARSKKWYSENKERTFAVVKKWVTENPKRVCANTKKCNQAPANFDPWGHRLVIDDRPKQDSDDKLSVVCAYCGQRFRPTLRTTMSRVYALEGKGYGECRFYCGDSCKEACPTFNQKDFFKGQDGKNGTSRETSAWLRQEVFKRDNWKCQKCGMGVEATLHAHHIKPAAEFPVEILDLPNLITLCKNCHNEIHHLPGCGYREILHTCAKKLFH